MRLYSVLIVTFTLLSHITTCNLSEGKTTRTFSVPAKVLLKPSAAGLTENEAAAVVVKASKLGMTDKIKVGQFSFNDKLKDAQFVDANHGWAANEQALYKTADGGMRWERVAPTLPADSRLSSFSFADAGRGWLAVVTRTYNERGDSATSSLVMATADAGRTWTVQAKFPEEVEVFRVRFLNADEGLIAGTRVTSHKPSYNEPFAAVTGDGGRTWVDLSEKLKSALPTGVVYDINWSSPSQIYVLTTDGGVASSADRGKTWSYLIDFDDERPNGTISSTGYRKLALDRRERLRVVAGAEGDEGYWGDLITTHEGDSWNSYELSGTPLRDVVFLSDREVLACGVHFFPSDEKPERRRRPAGVILHSLDGGKNWSVLYFSQLEETFISITKIDQAQFYAVSDGGTFLRFTLKK
ncbi:MAG: WD40/YVTN/BNR-like repeat-containing protein [Pyrinomonadaceae bacterium]